MLDTRIVVGRDRAGKAFALRDACPHRGMPLSYGWFDGKTIQCGYHGWKFDALSGQCREIPSCAQGQDLHCERIFAGHLEVEERDGYVWVYMPETGEHLGKGSATPPGPAPALPTPSGRYRSFQLTSLVPIHADHALTSLMDPVHGPFVHSKWWWFARLLLHLRPDKGDEERVARDMERLYSPLPLGFRDSTSQPITAAWFRKRSGSSVTDICADYVMPYHRVGLIQAGKYWVSLFVTVTPLTKTSSRIDVQVAWNIFMGWPFGAAILKWLFWIFVEQDRVAMTRQAAGLLGEPRLMLVDDADRPLRWFHEMKRAWLSSKRLGREFEHPVKEPVKLRWRATDYDDILR